MLSDAWFFYHFDFRLPGEVLRDGFEGSTIFCSRSMNGIVGMDQTYLLNIWANNAASFAMQRGIYQTLADTYIYKFCVDGLQYVNAMSSSGCAVQAQSDHMSHTRTNMDAHYLILKSVAEDVVYSNHLVWRGGASIRSEHRGRTTILDTEEMLVSGPIPPNRVVLSWPAFP